MMFLLRMAFWVSVALALIPTFAPKQAEPVVPDVATFDIVSAASATFADLSGLCERRPEACAVGGHLAAAFGRRAREGAQILYGLVGERLSRKARPDAAEPRDRQEHPAVAAAPEQPAADPGRPSQHTLTSADMAPPWHGPQPRRDGKHAT
jgi:hypothetical protein